MAVGRMKDRANGMSVDLEYGCLRSEAGPSGAGHGVEAPCLSAEEGIQRLWEGSQPRLEKHRGSGRGGWVCSPRARHQGVGKASARVSGAAGLQSLLPAAEVAFLTAKGTAAVEQRR